MMGEKFFGVLKTPSELDTQLEQVQEKLGNEPEHSLIPQSLNRDQILSLPVSELKQQFARRYQIYTELLRTRAHADIVLLNQSIQHFKKWLAALNSLDAYIAHHYQGEAVTLRARQITVFEDLRNFLEAGGESGYVSLPTGVGKTILFTEFIEALDLKTLIVVPTNILLDQVGAKMDEFAQDIDLGKINKNVKQYDKKVTVITYQSLAKQIAAGNIDPEEYECLILDEAHESLSESRKIMVDKFSNAIKLGFTATPDFSSRKKLSQLLPTEIHAMKIREAIEEGMLCSVSAMIVRTSADLSKVSSTTGGDYSEAELARAVNIASRNKAAVQMYKTYFPSERAVAYCVGVDHAQMVAKEFREAGIAAAAVSGKTPDEELRLNLARFKTGQIQVLCNADLLIAGFDEPRASVCLNLRPTTSRIVAEQRAGRVLRLDPERKDKQAHVVDFLDAGGDDTQIFLPPILFSEILGGAYAISSSDEESGWGRGVRGRDKGGEYATTPIIDIPGIEVVFDVEEVMKITNEVAADREQKNPERIKDIETLKNAIRALGLSKKYLTEQGRSMGFGPLYDLHRMHHPGWPAWLTVRSWPGFISGEDVFGVEYTRNFTELKREVDALHLNIQEMRKKYPLDIIYSDLQKEHPWWPTPQMFVRRFAKQGYYQLFGIDIYFSVDTLPEVRAIIHSMKPNIESAQYTGHWQKLYRDLEKQNPRLPSITKLKKMKGFVNFRDLFMNKEG